MGSILMEPEYIPLYSNILYPGHNVTTICLSLNKFTSKGLFHHTIPFDYSLPLLLAQLSLGCILTLIAIALLRPFGQPSMVTQMLAGLIVGPSLLGRIPGFLELVYPLESMVMIDSLAFFGFIFYFFLVGVQLDPWIFKKVDKNDMKIGLTTVSFGLVLSMFGVAMLQNGDFNLNQDLSYSLPFVAMTSSILSFPIIAQYLTEVNMVNTDIGRIALAASLVSNIYGICIITSLSLITMHVDQVAGALQRFFLLLFFTIFIVLVVRPLIIWALKKAPRKERVSEGLVILVLIGVLISAFFSKAIDTRIHIGPMILGIVIPAGPPLGSALMYKLDVITSWILMPVYYVKNGLVIDISSLKFQNYMYIQYITLLACLGKFLGAFLSSMYVKLPFKDAVQMGLVLNVQGVLELSLLKLLKKAKLINDEAFIVACVSMILVTGTVAFILKCLHDPTKRRKARRRRLIDLAPESELRMVACVHDQDDVFGINSLIENLNPTTLVPISVYLIHFIELVGRAHPVLIPHKLARVKSSRAPGSKNIVNAFKLVQQSYDNGAMQLNSYTAISSYTSMHDEVYELSATRRTSLIIIPFHKRYTNAGSVEFSNPGIKIMNYQILETAPCTTAILVDRAPILDSKTNLQGASSSLNQVAVFFIGGRDDREALALGAKMASQSDITLTIIRILEHNEHAKDSSINTVWDNKAISQVTRQMMRGNRRVVYTEAVVKDATGTVDVIRAVENQYELIIVGRNHDEQSPILHSLSEWTEESELGTLGDMFALADSKITSRILVVQHPKDIGLDPEPLSSHHALTLIEQNVPLHDMYI